jgi:hypothetical protein
MLVDFIYSPFAPAASIDRRGTQVNVGCNYIVFRERKSSFLIGKFAKLLIYLLDQPFSVFSGTLDHLFEFCLYDNIPVPLAVGNATLSTKGRFTGTIFAPPINLYPGPNNGDR